MHVLDLFSGIGGFSLGLERAGMRTIAFCEIDPFCRRVLRKHWPDVPIHGDVRELTSIQIYSDAIRRGCEEFGVEKHGGEQGALRGEPDGFRSWRRRARPIDLICGGFPCQDISVAGKGAGIEGSRSGLWSEYARIIGEVRPRYVIVENVAALLGRGIGRVLGDLAALGFDCEWHCIPASAVGAPHRRDRVWIIAYSDITRPQGLFGQQIKQGASQLFSLGLIGNSGWWLIEPDVGRVAHGVPFELDLIREIENGNCNCQETKPKAQVVIWHLLRAMWQHREAAKTSSDLYRRRLYDSVPELPQGNPCTFWVLGPWIEEDQELCNLWQQFCTKPFKKAQDLQQELLERIGTKKRPQALGSRVDRLRSLGNAIVPQIAEIIGKAILAHSSS